MTYCYQRSGKFGERLLLGSVIRALGKGWRVEAKVSSDSFSLFKKFKQQLKNPDQFHISITVGTPELQLGESKRQHSIRLDDTPDVEAFDLISSLEHVSLHKKGVIAVTGAGKGKTTLGLGFAGLAIADNKKALVIQWYKERKSGDLTWAINEHFFPNRLMNPELVEFFPTGLGFFGSPSMDRVKGDHAYQQHRKKAYHGIELAKKLIQERKHRVVVLDELIDTVREIAQNIEYPLIDLVDLQSFLEWVCGQSATVIVTGRRVTEDWRKYISESIVVSEIKHPWSAKRMGAISGLDF